MKILVFAPVLRQGSFNKKLIRLVSKHLQKNQGNEVELIEFNDFPMPVYDADLESNEGIPKAVLELGKKVANSDAIIISSPEYNGSIPGPFKNAIDWLSRIHPVPLEQKQICLIGASTGYFAAIRGTLHSRIPLQKLKAHVYPDYFGVANSEQAFDEKGELKEAEQAEQLHRLIDRFIEYARNKNSSFDRLDEFMEEQKRQPFHH